MAEFDFIKAGDDVINMTDISWLDFSKIEDLQVVIYLKDGRPFVAKGIDAIETALRTKPSVLENKRLKWPKHVWSVHNLIGHPLMQILVYARQYKAAFWVHDKTVPKPIGKKQIKP